MTVTLISIYHCNRKKSFGEVPTFGERVTTPSSWGIWMFNAIALALVCGNIAELVSRPAEPVL